nr:hypothetical protein [Microbispora cellulosiformans]
MTGDTLPPVEPRPEPGPVPGDPPQIFEEPDYDAIDEEVTRGAQGRRAAP